MGGEGDSRPLAIVDAENNRTTLSYETLFDGTRALKKIERPVVGALEFEYGVHGRCTKIIDQDSHETVLGWDSAENRTSILDAEGHTFDFDYTALRQQKVMIDPLGGRSTTVYDSSGNATGQIDPLGYVTTLTYDSSGGARTLQNPLGHVTTYTRDGVGRITETINPLGFTNRYSYTLMESSRSLRMESRRQPSTTITTRTN